MSIKNLWLTIVDREDGPEVESVDFDLEGAASAVRDLQEDNDSARIERVSTADIVNSILERRASRLTRLTSVAAGR
jgi:hypothetical protein